MQAAKSLLLASLQKNDSFEKMTPYLILNENELVEMEIHHSKKPPFRLLDVLKMLVFGVLLSVAIASFWHDGIFSIAPVFVMVMIVFFVIPFVHRWKKLQPLKYYATNERLIIYDTASAKILHSFEFKQFPEMEFRENANNSGYIILGEVQPAFGRFGLFGAKVGVNLADHEIVLENIPEVRKTFYYLKSKVENIPSRG